MEDINFLENLATRLAQIAMVKNVYGEPIVSGDKSIIPVEQIFYGFGGAYDYGQKPKKISTAKYFPMKMMKKRKAVKDLMAVAECLRDPIGIYKILKRGTRFIPADNTQQIIAALLPGILLKTFIAEKMRKLMTIIFLFD